ncbi:M81 family metallopeptidase [Chitinivorax sp. B]|uniref:M81 family metallopeptidase n=1 Tax=Chitinivorax sp. B TaxID=2502235 RepID=UPI0010F4D64A|nr:M81 family metallopeptidase [Chitinivorax sp. B]
MPRVVVAGFQHETNTFSPVRTGFQHFVEADAWPGLTTGEAVAMAVAGANLPLAGAIDALVKADLQPVPLLWASANPSGRVTDDAFEAVWWLFEEGLRQAGRIDAVYLDLHGAMVTESLEDGEGEWLRRTRQCVGDDIPIVASLDFHANVSQQMVALADALVGYRTYPHVDMAETGARAIALLLRLIRGELCHSAFRQLPFIIAMPWQCSLIDPVARLMRQAEIDEQQQGVVSVSFLPGFPLADITDSAPSILVYADTQAAADTVADELAEAVIKAEPEFNGKLWPPTEALAYAKRSLGQGGPVILADTCDNAGGGAASDAAAIIQACLDADAQGAVVGLLCDPTAAAAAHAAGLGATLHRAIGQTETACLGEWRVDALGDGCFDATGPFYAGCSMELGPMARLSYRNVTVLVSSRKQQAADQAMFRHLGIEPAQVPILILKSSVHFRADFGVLAREILVVESVGDHVADLSKLDYQYCTRHPAGCLP